MSKTRFIRSVAQGSLTDTVPFAWTLKRRPR